MQCEQCGKYHGYQCFDKVREHIYWFCGQFCRGLWRSNNSTDSQREFGPNGGWQ